MGEAIRLALIVDTEGEERTPELLAMAAQTGWEARAIRTRAAGILAAEGPTHGEQAVELIRSLRRRPGLTSRVVRPGAGPPQRTLRVRAATLAPDVLDLPSTAVAGAWLRLAERIGARTLVRVTSDEVYAAPQQAEQFAAVWASADRLVVESEALAATLCERGVAPDRIAVIAPAAAPEPERRPIPGRDAAEPLRLVSFGALSWLHGYEHALVAVRMLCDRGVDCRYRIVGRGPHEDAVAFAVAELGLEDRVELTAPGARTLRAELEWADALVAAGIVMPAPRAIVNAQAAGVPVIGPDLAAGRADSEAALSTAPLDPQALAATIELLCSDAELRSRLAAGARRLALSAPTPQEEAQCLHELHRGLAPDR